MKQIPENAKFIRIKDSVGFIEMMTWILHMYIIVSKLNNFWPGQSV